MVSFRFSRLFFLCPFFRLYEVFSSAYNRSKNELIIQIVDNYTSCCVQPNAHSPSVFAQNRSVFDKKALSQVCLSFVPVGRFPAVVIINGVLTWGVMIVKAYVLKVVKENASSFSSAMHGKASFTSSISFSVNGRLAPVSSSWMAQQLVYFRT